MSGLLTAWRVAELNPDVRVEVYERQARVGGDHTWSYNASDIPEHLRDWFAPFARHAWPRYDVRFPKRTRTLEIGYRTGDSDSLRAAIAPLVEQGRIILHTGKAVEPEALPGPVLDARGFAPRPDEMPGWQKFVGRTIRTERPHGVEHPVIMDATVEQIDGYRFMYLLPFSDTEMLVEDTYFSDSPYLSENAIHARIEDYIAAKGWGPHSVVRTEKGVLPMMMATDRSDRSASLGLRGGFAVAATGFTVPIAVRVADAVAEAVRQRGLEAAPVAVADFRARYIHEERYARLLNRMFFRAAAPERRYVVLQRFYGLRQDLIGRFYRNALSPLDKLRILVGKPPVPVTKALLNFGEKAFIRRTRGQDSRDTHTAPP